MPAALPDDWTGGFVLLALVFVLSSLLDNIAGALIGATVARHVFRGGVRVGYLAALVAAANAGGAGSLLGDTTTTMLWSAGVNPLSVLDAYIGFVLAAPIGANVGAHFLDAQVLDEIPLIGLGVAAALLLTAPIARPDWSRTSSSRRGAIFLIALVSAASMMPVKSASSPSWATTLGLGFLSPVFDNIPLYRARHK